MKKPVKRKKKMVCFSCRLTCDPHGWFPPFVGAHH
jgi:hypothetical protein